MWRLTHGTRSVLIPLQIVQLFRSKIVITKLLFEVVFYQHFQQCGGLRMLRSLSLPSPDCSTVSKLDCDNQTIL